MTNTESWITDYFRRHGRESALDENELLNANYFDLELLDSLGVVQLVLGVEDEFGVRLESDQMQDPRFCSIRGLASIIDESRAAAA